MQFFTCKNMLCESLKADLLKAPRAESTKALAGFTPTGLKAGVDF